MGREKTNLSGLGALAGWSNFGMLRNYVHCLAARGLPPGAIAQTTILRGYGNFNGSGIRGNLGSCYLWSWR